MKPLFLLLLLFIPSAWAEEKRESRLSLSASLGSGSYSELELDGRIGLDPIWRMGLGVARSRTDSAGSTGSARIGIDGDLREAWNLRLAIQGSREPNEVRSIGFASGVTWQFSALWQGELLSALSLEFERNRFRQNLTGPGRVLSSSFNQTSFHLGLMQELADRVTAHLLFRKYRYNENATLINRAVSARRASGGSPDSFLAGFADQSIELGLDVFLSEVWALQPHGGRVLSAVDGNATKNLGLGVFRSLEKWEIGLDYTHSSPEQGSATELFSFQLAYAL